MTPMGKVIAQPDEYVLHATGWTVREYDALPEDFPRCELIGGELWLSPAPNLGHQDVVGVIFRKLADFCDNTGLGMALISPVDFEISDDDVLQPDVLVITREHPQYGKPAPRLTAPPLLAVEVLSTGSTKRDREVKFALYRDAGVLHYWIADPKAKSLEAWSLENGRYMRKAAASAPAEFSADPFPGLVFPLVRVFKFA